MSSIRTNSVRRIGLDHFEPEADSDPAAQRRLRGHLEQIDYAAYAANTAVLAQAVGPLDAAAFQRLAVAAAQARASWLKEALRISNTGHAPTPPQAERLAELRLIYDELTEAYEGLRRMVERGYVPYRAAT